MSSYLVTGTSRGIGLELVRQLVSQPKSAVRLVLASTRSEPTEALQELINKSAGRLVPVRFDPVDRASVQQAVPEIETLLGSGGLDVLVNNVGAATSAPGGISTMTDLSSVFNINVLSAHNVTSSLIHLVEQSQQKKVVNISTPLGTFAASPKYSVFPVPTYKITKAALNMLTFQWAAEYVSKGLVIFALAPGWVKTDLGGGDAADLTPEQSIKAVLEVIASASSEVSGKLVNVHVPGWENAPGMNQYGGGVLPW